MSYTKTKSRYASLLTRSRNLHLEYYAFQNWENGKCDIELLKKYEANEKVIRDYTKACQGKEPDLPIKELDKRINYWFENNKDSVDKFYAEYKTEFDKILSLKQFEDFYGEDEKDRECLYCNIKESEIETLRSKGEIKTKRLYTRGLKMEIDRRNPIGDYGVGNIALCCYWCNNAKTDEFTEEEFKPIAEAIKTIWKRRLAK